MDVLLACPLPALRICTFLCLTAEANRGAKGASYQLLGIHTHPQPAQGNATHDTQGVRSHDFTEILYRNLNKCDRTQLECSTSTTTYYYCMQYSCYGLWLRACGVIFGSQPCFGHSTIRYKIYLLLERRCNELLQYSTNRCDDV